MDLKLGRSAYERGYGRMPPVKLQNRFFEENPTDQQSGAALLSRPGTTVLTAFGEGPIRRLFSLDGVFNGDLFVVSSNALFRYSRDGSTKTPLVGTILGDGNPPIAATQDYLFIADGTSLQYYNGTGSFANGVLTFTGLPLNTETVTLGSLTYTWVTTLSAGPTVANEIVIGVDVETSIENFVAAVTAGPGIGSKYSEGTTVNLAATASENTATTATAQAVGAGAIGNTIVSTDTMTNASWGAATLEDGTDGALIGIPTPDDVAIVSIAVIGGYVLCVAAQSQRVYYIEPNITGTEAPVIDPLNFFEAESIPDQIIEAKVIGDEIYFLGVESTEVWYLSGASGVPFDRIKGRAFSRGIVEGTVVSIGSRIFAVGNDGVVYNISGGVQRVSTHAIEEVIREQRKAERQ